MRKKNLWALVLVILILGVVILFPACKREHVYTQSIKIATEKVDEKGSLVIIKSYRDSDLVNTLHFIDGDGDGTVDGKSGPKEQGYWPKGWGWLDDLYDDVVVGQSSLHITDGKITIQNGNTHEFRIGEYQCEQTTSTD